MVLDEILGLSLVAISLGVFFYIVFKETQRGDRLRKELRYWEEAQEILETRGLKYYKEWKKVNKEPGD